jgi:hypothetical protein
VQDLLICERNCAVFVAGSGRRDLRPGTVFNADENTAARLVAGGYARRLIEPAPLFADSTAPPKQSKRGKKKET